MSTSFRNLDLDSLLALRDQYRSNLAALELRAAKSSDTVPLENERADTLRALTDIDSEVKRRAGGIVPDPPELVEIREKLALFTQAIDDARERGEA
ncbi:MAG TPA: hypothetical protein VD886_13570, partial [Herpetosiphonaceae bacterium]|nr:hypothetical protein [Herpetosiphonaceae bacterium]